MKRNIVMRINEPKRQKMVKTALNLEMVAAAIFVATKELKV